MMSSLSVTLAKGYSDPKHKINEVQEHIREADSLKGGTIPDEIYMVTLMKVMFEDLRLHACRQGPHMDRHTYEELRSCLMEQATITDEEGAAQGSLRQLTMTSLQFMAKGNGLRVRVGDRFGWGRIRYMHSSKVASQQATQKDVLKERVEQEKDRTMDRAISKEIAIGVASKAAKQTSAKTHLAISKNEVGEDRRPKQRAPHHQLRMLTPRRPGKTKDPAFQHGWST